MNDLLSLAEEPGRHIYTIYLISQQYLGLDQQYDVYLDVLGKPPL